MKYKATVDIQNRKASKCRTCVDNNVSLRIDFKWIHIQMRCAYMQYSGVTDLVYQPDTTGELTTN